MQLHPFSLLMVFIILRNILISYLFTSYYYCIVYRKMSVKKKYLTVECSLCMIDEVLKVLKTGVYEKSWKEWLNREFCMISMARY